MFGERWLRARLSICAGRRGPARAPHETVACRRKNAINSPAKGSVMTMLKFGDFRLRRVGHGLEAAT